ncbi:MAG: hypothetical protein ACI4DO_06715 [Roseburia sp.]
MGQLTEQEKIEDFERIKDMLDELNQAAEILQVGEDNSETVMMVVLPTTMEDWEEEYKTDMHMATCYIMQPEGEEGQPTKYMMIYTPILVDVSTLDELEVLRYISELNRTLLVGSCFYGEDLNDGRRLVQIKWTIGGYAGEPFDEGIVCEALYELGSTYDTIKAHLKEMISRA